MRFLSVPEAKATTGLRLVLSVGVPNPWCEAAKAVLKARKVHFAAVEQQPMGANAELVAWTGCRNAPIAVYDSEPPRNGWYDIVMLAERLGSGASILPERSADRALCLGYAMEICGQDGFGWNRRISLMAKLFGTEVPSDAHSHQRELLQQYSVSKEAAVRAPGRIADILSALGRRMNEQRTRGSRYLIGDAITVVDLYWACFSQLIRPLPPAVNPMPEYLRPMYAEVSDDVAAAIDPILFDHRDYIFERHIGLPLEF